MGEPVRIDHLAVEHRDDTVFPAGGEEFLQGRDGNPEGRVGRGKHVLGAELSESQVPDPHRLPYRGIVRSVPHGPVDGLVMHQDHYAVPGVLHVAFDRRVAVPGGHQHTCDTVFVDVEVLPFLQPAAPVRNRDGKSWSGSPEAGTKGSA